MKTEIIYWSLILLLGLGACAEDTGNYDYKCINGITIKQLPTDYNDPKIIYVGDVVQFIPEFIFEKEQDTIGLSYLWIMDKDTVANTRNLNKVILLSPRNRVFGSYRVYDSKTDVEYITPFYLSIKASLENGWIFLCKKANGCGQLNFFRAEDKENDIKEWLLIDGYLDANGEDLGKEPISIRHHFLPMHSMYMFDNQISVICQGGPDLSIEVDGNTFKKVICNKDEFVSNIPPTNFIPQATFNADAGYSIMSGGKLYARARLYDDPFQEGFFTNFPIRPKEPLKSDYELAPIMLPFNFNEPFAALLFDKKNRSYMVTNGLEIMPLLYDDDTIKAFDPMNVGKQLLTVGRIKRAEHDFMTGGEFFAILQDQNGKYWEQIFSAVPPDFGGGFQSIREEPFGGAAYFSPQSLMATPTLTSYIYFTSGDGEKLYSYNFVTKETKEIRLTFSGHITAMAVEEGDEELIVGVNNNGVGDIYWLSIKLGKEGTINRKIIGKMGIPIDMKYKPDSWFW